MSSDKAAFVPLSRLIQILLMLKILLPGRYTTSIGVRELMFFFGDTQACDSTQLASNASAPTAASNPARRLHVPSCIMPALTGRMVSFLLDKGWYSPEKYDNFLRGVSLQIEQLCGTCCKFLDP
ncbi:TPA: hypothetical protein ACH3X1_008044 [Trebouxia sp. C0004]